jgi:hypothetical protein
MTDAEREYAEYQRRGRENAQRDAHNPNLPDTVRQANRDHLARNLED